MTKPYVPLSQKIQEMDSLDRLELELEIDKKRELRENKAFEAQLMACFPVDYRPNIIKLIELLDGRYQKKG